MSDTSNKIGGTIGLDGDTRRDWETDGPALEAKLAQLRESFTAIMEKKVIVNGFRRFECNFCGEIWKDVQASHSIDCPSSYLIGDKQ